MPAKFLTEIQRKLNNSKIFECNNNLKACIDTFKINLHRYETCISVSELQFNRDIGVKLISVFCIREIL